MSKSFKFGDEELVFEGNPGLFMKAKDIYNKCVDGDSDELDDLLEKFWDVVGHTYNDYDGPQIQGVKKEYFPILGTWIEEYFEKFNPLYIEKDKDFSSDIDYYAITWNAIGAIYAQFIDAKHKDANSREYKKIFVTTIRITQEYIYKQILAELEANIDFNFDEAAEIRKGLFSGRIEEAKKKDAVRCAILRNPFNYDIYKFVVQNFKDLSDDIIQISEYFGIDLYKDIQYLYYWHGVKFKHLKTRQYVSEQFGNIKSLVASKYGEQIASMSFDISKLKIYLLMTGKVCIVDLIIDGIKKISISEECEAWNDYVQKQVDEYQAIKNYVTERYSVLSRYKFKDVVNFLKRNFHKEGAPNFYIGDEIPSAKIQHVLNTYAREYDLSPKDIWVLWDDTVLGSARNGFVFTDTFIINDTGKCFRFSEMEHLVVGNDNRLICIMKNGTKSICIYGNVSTNNRIALLIQWLFYPAMMSNEMFSKFASQSSDDKVAEI